ncbi:MAG: Crp/Fnr family transcriptional regulator [Chitinophagaceae bacterium]|nr:Crp/Fnr family transcriptional regulator [Chitinophagaceae bacterium]
MAIDNDLLLAWGAAYKQYKKGEVIFRENNAALFYHQLESGSVKMINCNEQGREFIQGIFSAGESFGEPPLFYDGTYPADAVAESDCTILRLRKVSFFEVLKDNPAVLMTITKTLAKRLHHKAIVARELACHEPEHRVLTILEMVKTKGNAKQHNGKIKVPYTRQQIADMTGLRVETIIRTIRMLETKAIVSIINGKVYIES